MKFIKQMIIAVAVATSGLSAAQAQTAASQCKIWNWKPGQEIVVEAALYRHTAITLPEAAIDVLWASKELWTNEFVKNHIFVNPNSAAPQGYETTLTAVGESNNTYNFILRRVANPKSNCLIVKTDGAMVTRGAWNSRDSAQQAQVQVMSQQIAQLNAEKASMSEENARQNREAIKAYRSALHTAYTWTEASGWYAGNGTIASVQDDGRLTYVRLKSDNRGIMSVLAEIDGEKEILESSYDAAKREYRIAGVFPKLLMRAGNSSLEITRN